MFSTVPSHPAEVEAVTLRPALQLDDVPLGIADVIEHEPASTLDMSLDDFADHLGTSDEDLFTRHPDARDAERDVTEVELGRIGLRDQDDLEVFERSRAWRFAPTLLRC